MEYEVSEVRDLRETLEQTQIKYPKYVDFTDNVTKCPWREVIAQLAKAQAAADESERRGKTPVKAGWRAMGQYASILDAGVAAIPDDLCVLAGGLAVIFSLAKNSELNRRKILSAFGTIPHVIEHAQNKARTFPLDSRNAKSVQLHEYVQELRRTLLRVLPALINILVPKTFPNYWKSPFRGMKIDNLLDQVSSPAKRVKMCAESLIDDFVVGTYSAQMTIQAQLDEVIQNQKTLAWQMAMDSARGKSHLFQFLWDDFNPLAMGAIAGRDSADMSELGTALPGYTPEDLLRTMDINHHRMHVDATHVWRRGHTLDEADIERAARLVTQPQVKELVSRSNPGPKIIAVDGHFDRAQMGKISPLSYVCVMLAQTLRQQAQQLAMAEKPPPPGSASSHRSVVLEYFCALHTSEDDDLRGPQGLVRCLSTQLILALVANQWIGPDEAVHLPHLRGEGEEEALVRRDLDAVCRLFVALVRLVPDDVPVYCLVDGWSAFEREDLAWRADYETVLHSAFTQAATAGDGSVSPDGGANFRLLLTSPTKSRWLDDFLMPGQRVSRRSGGPDADGGGAGEKLAEAWKRRLGRRGEVGDHVGCY